LNVVNITSRFALLTGLDKAELYKWRVLIDDACAYIKSHTKKTELDESETKRLEMLCAVYAFRLYSMCNDDNITSFTAGDVHITSPDVGSKAESLWKEYSQKSQDLLDTKGFIFGRVV
jgi:hypothetical protein